MTKCRDSWRQVHCCGLWFCHNPVFFFLFLHPLRHRFGQLVQLKFWVQQRELKWLMLNKWWRWFHSSCVTFSFCQYVCKLMFGVDIPYLNLGIQTDPIKQPIQSNSVVLDTCLIVGLLNLIIISITASLSSKTYNIAPNREDLTLDETWSTLFRSRLWNIGTRTHLGFEYYLPIHKWWWSGEFIKLKLPYL